jgi:hypothetical protein
MPSFAADAPLHYYSIPEPERRRRCKLTTETCVVDKKVFFARGCIEIPVHGEADPFIWGAWVSLSAESFKKFKSSLWRWKRSKLGPLSGCLSADFVVYPEIENLQATLHLQDDGIRPRIELAPTDHPLAVEQREGISIGRVAEIYAACMHDDAPT